MPLTQIEAYHLPADLESAWALVRDADGRVRLLGGGTDLVPSCPPGVRELVDLADAGLRDIEVDADGAARLGAMATFTDLLEHAGAAVIAGGVIPEVLRQVGSVLHRNSATLGGHLARGRLSDVIPVLLALDTRVVVYDGDRHELPLGDYLADRPEPHIVVEVRVPALPARSAAAFARFSRAAFDHALVNGCCRVDLDGGGAVAEARVVVGETASLGRRVPAAEDALVGAPLSAEAAARAADATRAEVALHGDWVASADFRRHLGGVVVERCLATVSKRLNGGAG